MGSKIQVTAGNVKIGGGAKVSVQSMLNIPSTDIEGSVRQKSLKRPVAKLFVLLFLIKMQ